MAISEKRLLNVERNRLLGLIAAAIHEFTIVGRGAHLDRDLEAHYRTNEEIHRLSGHLRDLADPAEIVTESRAEAIAGGLGLLGADAITRLERHYLS